MSPVRLAEQLGEHRARAEQLRDRLTAVIAHLDTPGLFVLSEHVLDLVDAVLDLVGGPFGLAFALEVLVVGEVARGFLGTAFEFRYVRSTLSWS